MTEAKCHNTSPCLTNPPRTTVDKKEILEIRKEIAILKKEISDLMRSRGIKNDLQ